jgi:hypothetical protein
LNIVSRLLSVGCLGRLSGGSRGHGPEALVNADHLGAQDFDGPLDERLFFGFFP